VPISCIIPNYNHEKYLDERLQTVLGQNLKHFECIFLDDGSSDGSNSIFNKYLKLDSRLHGYFNTSNSGSTFFQWNKGIALAKNNIITIQESDDSSHPDLFESLYEEITRDSSIVLVFSQSYIIDSFSNILGLWEYTDLDFNSSFLMDGIEFINRFLIHSNHIPNASAVMFRKDIFDLVGGANPKFKANGDWLLWLKMLCHGKIAFISRPLNKYRRHKESVTFKNISVSTSDYFEKYSMSLRKEYSQYLISLNDKHLMPIVQLNKKYISFDQGHLSLHMLKQKKHFLSFYHLLMATIQGGFKTYYFKTYLLDFCNNLFKKS
jgi:glycosyltransferase involved in cell wall biosynthesis